MAYSYSTAGEVPGKTTEEFYAAILDVLTRHSIPFMLGGSFAAAHYTRREPHTKDLDIFLPPRHVEHALEVLTCAGFDTHRPFPFWLAKVEAGDDLVDLICRAASGLWEVDDEWVKRAETGELLGRTVRYTAVEELVWSKVSVMDRTRYDGNDVLHLLQAKAYELDWERLRELAGKDWRLLLAHITLFGYVYPDLVTLVPRHLVAELALRLLSERPDSDEDDEPLCRGTLISNTQYQLDVEQLGYRDARLEPWGRLSREDLQPWIDAVKRGDT